MSGNEERSFTTAEIIADARRITQTATDADLNRYWRAFDRMCEDHERANFATIYLVTEILTLEIKIRYLEREVLGR